MIIKNGEYIAIDSVLTDGLTLSGTGRPEDPLTVIGGAGERGPQGPQGPEGPRGVGIERVDSTPTPENDGQIITFVMTDKTTSDPITIYNGENGEPGVSPAVSVDENTPKTHIVTFTYVDGDKTLTKNITVLDGADGKTPTFVERDDKNGYNIILNDVQVGTILNGADGKTPTFVEHDDKNGYDIYIDNILKGSIYNGAKGTGISDVAVSQTQPDKAYTRLEITFDDAAGTKKYVNVANGVTPVISSVPATGAKSGNTITVDGEPIFTVYDGINGKSVEVSVAEKTADGKTVITFTEDGKDPQQATILDGTNGTSVSVDVADKTTDGKTVITFTEEGKDPQQATINDGVGILKIENAAVQTTEGYTELVVTYTNNQTTSIFVKNGEQGEAGKGIVISGSAKTLDELDEIAKTLTPADAGHAYLCDEDRKLYVWDGEKFGPGTEFKGPQGVPGENGKTYIPVIDDDYRLTWTLTATGPTDGLIIKGPPGDPGVSPTVSTDAIDGGNRVTFTYGQDKDQTKSIDVMNGVSPTATITDGSVAGEYTITITDASHGETSKTIKNGVNGSTPTFSAVEGGTGIYVDGEYKGLIKDGVDGKSVAFKSVDASINMLTHESDPTATASITGPIDQSVATFTFGIPEPLNGDNGYTPTAVPSTITDATHKNGGNRVTFSYPEAAGIREVYIDVWNGNNGDNGYTPIVEKSTIPPTTEHKNGGTEVTFTYDAKAGISPVSFNVWNGESVTSNSARFDDAGNIITTTYATKDDIKDFTTMSEVEAKGYITNTALEGYAKSTDVPTKVSELENDSKFITSDDLPTVPTKVSELENDSKFITSDDLPTVPTKVSELENDSKFTTMTAVEEKGYITNDALNGYLTKTSADTIYQPIGDYALKSDIPSLDGYLTKTSADATYAKKTDIPSLDGYLTKTSADTIYQPIGNYITSANADATYAKKTDIPTVPTKVSDLENDSNFTTMTAVEEKGYITNSALEGYAKSSELDKYVTSAGLVADTPYVFMNEKWEPAYNQIVSVYKSGSDTVEGYANKVSYYYHSNTNRTDYNYIAIDNGNKGVLKMWTLPQHWSTMTSGDAYITTSAVKIADNDFRWAFSLNTAALDAKYTTAPTTLPATGKLLAIDSTGDWTEFQAGGGGGIDFDIDTTYLAWDDTTTPKTLTLADTALQELNGDNVSIEISDGIIRLADNPTPGDGEYYGYTNDGWQKIPTETGKYTAGDNIDISPDNEISVTDTAALIAGPGIAVEELDDGYRISTSGIAVSNEVKYISTGNGSEAGVLYLLTE